MNEVASGAASHTVYNNENQNPGIKCYCTTVLLYEVISDRCSEAQSHFASLGTLRVYLLIICWSDTQPRERTRKHGRHINHTCDSI